MYYPTVLSLLPLPWWLEYVAVIVGVLTLLLIGLTMLFLDRGKK